MQLNRITHHVGAERPLLVEFADDDGKEHTVEAGAGDVQTFQRFQKLAANRLGVWLEDPNDHIRSAAGRAHYWQQEVGEAFRAGRKKEEKAK